MKMIKKFTNVVYFIVCFSVLLSVNSYAYLDPATATYGVQIIAAVLVTGGALIGIFRHKIKRFFMKGKGKDDNLQKNKTDKNSNIDDMFD